MRLTMMIIREITENDIADWSEMRTDLWPETEDGHIQEIREYFEGSSVDIVMTYVAEADQQVIGFIELNIRNFAEGSRCSKIPYVEGWYIKPGYRGKGYGASLMRRAEQWALSQGHSELASDTELENTQSISMHKHLGFEETERVVCFLKKLDADK